MSEATARAVTAAYARASAQLGREFDPTTWSNTVWKAEAERYERAGDADAHYTLVLHLHRLREQWEALARGGRRGWQRGTVGERLTKR
ncbi:MAG: hypothetical protein HYU66_22740 [Armatimonadetes bacterium]|nr:hypothetical protein [Armatimonadota bacterium]